MEGLLTTLGSFLPSAMLLWLAASIHAQAGHGATVSPRGVRGMALALAAVGLWWPLQLASVAGPGAGALQWHVAL